MGTFKINAFDLCWIDGSKDNPDDKCLHGHTVAYIGKKKFEYDAPVSSTALYLLKSLTQDHIVYESDNQMLPCCGHFYIPDKTLNNVVIHGCINGIDWTVKHAGNNIILIQDDGTEEIIPFIEYQSEVFEFADTVENFYKNCSPKNFYGDKFETDCDTAFWNEWHRRRNT